MVAYNLVKTVSTGDIISASDRNTEHQNHINNNTVSGVTGDSGTVGAMQTVVSPGGVGSESLATTLQGELERLRYVIKTIHGGAQWYPGQAVMKVLQTVFNTTTTQTNTTSSTFTAATNASVTITPTSASNRILIAVSGCFLGATGSSGVTLKRGSTELTGVASGVMRSDIGSYASMNLFWIDSPATTSSTTYQVFIRSADNATTVQFGSNSTITALWAMEVV